MTGVAPLGGHEHDGGLLRADLAERVILGRIWFGGEEQEWEVTDFG